MTIASPAPEPLVGPVTMGDLLRFSVDEVGRGRECREKHQVLSKWAERTN